jgi:hypothetical protein
MEEALARANRVKPMIGRERRKDGFGIDRAMFMMDLLVLP